ncbi:MAG: hypothetical protein AAFW89_13135, partial [Bacteroidota bacterium]
QNEAELYFLVRFLNVMTMFLADSFSEKMDLFRKKYLPSIEHAYKNEPNKNPSTDELQKALMEVQENLNREPFPEMKEHFIKALLDGLINNG